MMVGWLFLAFGAVALWFAFNTWRPIRTPAPLAIVSFFAGWLTGELALHHLAWQMVAALGFALAGALTTWEGRAGLALTMLSWLLLVVHFVRADRTRASVDLALKDGLGEGYRAHLAPRFASWLAPGIEWTRLLFPFPVLRHSDVERKRNIRFHPEDPRLTLDVIRHRAHPTSCPTLIYVHGGGWVIGQRRYQGLPMMQHLAARGWVCFSVGYRLSPGATFPDHLIDVKRAIAWVKAHAVEYGADPEFVVIAGNSAGAHIASLAALTPNDPEYQPSFEHADTSVKGCLAFYGIYDFTDRHGHWPDTSFERMLARHVMKCGRSSAAEAYEKASPIARIHGAAPPFFVVHGDRDSLAPTAESRRFVAAFREEARAPIAYVEVPGAQHAFEIFPSSRSAHVVHGATEFAAYLYSAHLEGIERDVAVAAPVTAPARTPARSSEPRSAT